jgi:hypothetical protein
MGEQNRVHYIGWENYNATGSQKETQRSITTYFEDMVGRMHGGDGQTPQNIGPDFRWKIELERTHEDRKSVCKQKT